jgi:hypothetical protein
MPFRIVRKGVFSPAGVLKVRLWDPSLFGQRMRQDGHVAAMKEVQDTIIDVPLPCPQLVEAIAYVIGFGAAELVSGFGKPLNARDAFGIRSAVAPAQRRQLLHHWRAATLLICSDAPGKLSLFLHLRQRRLRLG